MFRRSSFLHKKKRTITYIIRKFIEINIFIKQFYLFRQMSRIKETTIFFNKYCRFFCYLILFCRFFKFIPLPLGMPFAVFSPLNNLKPLPFLPSGFQLMPDNIKVTGKIINQQSKQGQQQNGSNHNQNIFYVNLKRETGLLLSFPAMERIRLHFCIGGL